MAAKNADILLHTLKTFLIFVLINVRFSDQTLLTVTRKADGDVLKVSTPLFCSNTVCERFDAQLISEPSQLSSSCSCQCKGTFLNPVITFYEKTSKCQDDKKITADSKYTICLYNVLYSKQAQV